MWLAQGKRLKATHLIVVCDTYDYEDYPVFVRKVEFEEEPTPWALWDQGHPIRKTHNVKHVVERLYSGQNMQKAMEVYRIADDWDEQLAEPRCWRFE